MRPRALFPSHCPLESPVTRLLPVPELSHGCGGGGGKVGGGGTFTGNVRTLYATLSPAVDLKVIRAD